MRRTLAVAIGVAIWAIPAMACLNDSASQAAEEEFRSRYETPAPVARQDSFSHWGLLFTLAGAFMGTSSVLVAKWSLRDRSRAGQPVGQP